MSDVGKLLFEATDGKLVFHPTSGALVYYPNAVYLTVNGDIEYYWWYDETWNMRVPAGTHYCPWVANQSSYYKSWWIFSGVSGMALVEKVSDDPETWEARIGYQNSSYDWCWVYYQAATLTGTYSYDREFKTSNTRHDITAISVARY